MISHGLYKKLIFAVPFATRWSSWIIAIKSCPVDDFEAMQAMKKEVKTLQNLRHAHLIDFLGVRSWAPPGELDPTHMHVYLELIPGGTIAEMLSIFGPVCDNEQLRSTNQNCCGNHPRRRDSDWFVPSD